MNYVYLLRCSDGTLYCGWTNDLSARVKAHNAGKGAKYTRSRRPGFTAAARPDTAIALYERVVALCRERGFHVETGKFGADMSVASVNDGPVTILLETTAQSGKEGASPC